MVGVGEGYVFKNGEEEWGSEKRQKEMSLFEAIHAKS